MSNNGGASYGPDEHTSFGLQPPQPPQGAAAGGAYGPGAYGSQQGGAYDPQAGGGNGPNPYAAEQEPAVTQPGHAAPGRPQAPQPHAPQPPPQAHAIPTQVSPQQPMQPDPGAGRLIAGRYRLLSKLGAGGMGTVWRAKDETVDREVAVKEPRVPDHLPERERATAFERMRREARAAARLDHPAVVNVHDVAIEDGQPWIVMEFVQGRSLGAALQEGTLGAREAARVGLEVLNALDAAHQAGILHRDVKPDNVMLGRHDRVVLTDFGIAQIEGETNLTDTGGFVGSPEFIAPERVLGQRPGPASDLWSLGVVLYAATEGVSPFRRNNTPATLQSVLNATPAAPASAQGPLAEVINGLLNKDAAHRPDATRVRQLLTEAAKPPVAAPTQVMASGGVGGPAEGGIRVGKKALLGIGAGLVALVVAGVVVVMDPFAGDTPEGFHAQEFKGLNASVSMPGHYKQSGAPETYAAKTQHWLSYSDPSGSITITLDFKKKSEDTSNEIASSAAAEAYQDVAELKDGTSDLSNDNAAKVETDTEVKYKEKKAAENSFTYDDGDEKWSSPREAKVFYVATGNGDMYKLAIRYPGKGDFTERGREVAKEAIAGLKLDNL